jgi:hypothetical protein
MRSDAARHHASPIRWRTRGGERTASYILRVREGLQSGNRRQLNISVEDVSSRSTQRFTSFEMASAWLGARIASHLNRQGNPSGSKAAKQGD